MTESPLLSIQNLRVDLAGSHRHASTRTVIHSVSLEILPGQTMGLVGESGSGKSMTAKAVMRLLPHTARVDGKLEYCGKSIFEYGAKALADYRARSVGMIYQDPRASINPLSSIGEFLTEGLVASGRASRSQALQLACQLLTDVGISDAERRMHQYPHQLSGGLLQRMMIVMALLPSPNLILADEPTTALDVTVQSDVMAILAEQCRDRRAGLLFITHDLDLAAAVTQTLAVMYAGVIVESGSAKDVYATPRHPYTAGLLASRPRPNKVQRLRPIPGRPISAFEAGRGCAFAGRCTFAQELCHRERPALEVKGEVSVACHRADELSEALASEVSL